MIESPRHPGQVAARLKDITDELGIPFVFKASYDNANRSSLGSYRGPGLERGLEILAGVKARLKVPILTDVHEVEQVERVAQVADILQIPAFLCRQTDIVMECAAAGAGSTSRRPFMAPWYMRAWSRRPPPTATRLLVTERDSASATTTWCGHANPPRGARARFPVSSTPHACTAPGAGRPNSRGARRT